MMSGLSLLLCFSSFTLLQTDQTSLPYLLDITENSVLIYIVRVILMSGKVENVNQKSEVVKQALQLIQKG